jgi:hypothetical protein
VFIAKQHRRPLAKFDRYSGALPAATGFLATSHLPSSKSSPNQGELFNSSMKVVPA